MQIRHENAADCEAIGKLVYAAFLNHPQHEPGSYPPEPGIVTNLRNSGALALSAVAEDDGVVVGHIAYSEVLIDGQNRGWYGLGPVAVAPTRQGQGIGSVLIRQSIAELREQGARGIALAGEPEFYKRFGFRNDSTLTLHGVLPQYFLVLPLETPVPCGTVTFHAAFGV